MQGRHFEITFYKNVASPYGREQEVRQGCFRYYGTSRGDALLKAKKAFCRSRNQLDWHIHADRYEIHDCGE